MSTPLRPPLSRPAAPYFDKEAFYEFLCPQHDLGLPFRVCTCEDVRDDAEGER